VPNSASLGFELSASLSSPDNGITPAFWLRNGNPASLTKPPLDDAFGAVQVGRPVTTSITFYETNRRTPYSMQYNLSIQRELPQGFLVDVSFVSNLSRKLATSNLPLNQIRPEKMGATAGQRDRPFPQFNGVAVQLPTMGVASYNAGVLRVERRFSKGFSLLSTYTWSKNLNNASEGGGGAAGDDGGYSNLYNRRADWGPSGNDIRHRMTTSGVLDLPFGKGRPWLTSGVLQHILGGWSTGALLLIQSGDPVSVNTQVNTTNAFSAGGLRPDVLRDPNLPNSEKSLARWFDTSAFVQPANYTFGNAGINLVRADGTVNLDLSILRNFRISEDKRIQFRAESFNSLNHTNFGAPGSTLNGPGFGVVAGAGPARSIQLGLRLVF
jgi:hypothetical protein